MTPAQIVLNAMQVGRSRGAPFDDLWADALRRAVAAEHTVDERAQWMRALNATREAWQAAYDGMPASKPLRALSLVAAERAVGTDSERSCERCGTELPAGAHAKQRYCSRSCQRTPVALAA